MKKKNIILITALLAIGFSCKDEALDPLQFEKIKKGTIIALRGQALQTLYHDGAPIAVVAPDVATGNETFNYDAEYLAVDPNSLESLDIYVVKGSGKTSSLALIKNVPFSQFKVDGTYPRPWVSISLKFTDMLKALGLSSTIPLSKATVDALLKGSYRFGINIQTDLNLKDGSKILGADITNTGLFGSDQFYPAMKLNYPMIGYCAYDPNTWVGTWNSVESPGSTEDNVITMDSSIPNRFHMDNFWGDGVDAYFDMNVSTTPFDQTITIPLQTTDDPGDLSGTGTYDQCTETIVLKCLYVYAGTKYRFVYTLNRK